MTVSTAVGLTTGQERIATLGKGKYFAEGPAGTGKTTAAVLHIGKLLQQRVPANDITVVVPHPLLMRPYRTFDTDTRDVPGAELNITTYARMIRRAIELFWPIVAETVGHGIVRETPVFLNFEAAVLHLSRVIDPMIEQRRLFDTARLPRRRLYAQILDDLNKSAVVGFPVAEIAFRLEQAWTGADEQTRMYDDVQLCATAFRDYCLENGVLDFSLAVETFRRFVWPLDACRAWLTQSARYLIYDNAEEDSPAAHDLMLELVEQSENALVMFDRDGVYRRLLGADEVSARRLIDVCDEHIVLDEPVGGSEGHAPLVAEFGVSFGRVASEAEAEGNPLADAEFRNYKYFPDMVEAVCDEILRLTDDEGIDANQIAVVMPYLSDALRFAFVNRLEQRGVPVRSIRPSRPLGGEPAARTMLILAQLAHPAWDVRVNAQDVAQALGHAVGGLDPVRAYLVASTYRPSSGLPAFAELSAMLQERITPEAGKRYDLLRHWLMDAGERPAQPLDHFFARLYSEVLAQPGFRFHEALDAGQTAAALVRSAREFRQLAESLDEPHDTAGYVQRVLDGLIGEQWLTQTASAGPAEGVHVMPAYTFLMTNQTVLHQFWIDIGSSGWAERMQQPLSNPYVLSRNWPVGQRWTAADDMAADAEQAYRVVAGLLRRCTDRVWLTSVEYNEQGFTQQGPLLLAMQRILRRRGLPAAQGAIR